MARPQGDGSLFHFVMIKPTHYDDDGYPIQWLRSAIPSNTLACLNALAEDARQREVLGAGVEIRLHTYDETNRRVRPEQIIAHDPQGGRAGADRPGRRAVEPVSARRRSGAAVSRRRPAGVHRRFPRLRLHRRCCRRCPPTSKPRRRWAFRSSPAKRRSSASTQVLRDAWNGTLKPLYNYMDDLPALGGEPAPYPAAQARAAHRRASLSSIDLGRGCPYQCSFCTIINVQGRKSRFRTADDLERIVRENYAAGHQALLHHRRQFRPQPATGKTLFDRLIATARGRGHEHRLHHPGRHALPQDPELHREGDAGRRAAGLHRAGEHQPGQSASPPRSGRTRSPNIARCCRSGASTAPSPMPATSSAFPADTKESILRDIEIIKRELPLDILEFFFLTPLPGSEDHKVLCGQGDLDGPGHEQVRPQPPRRASSGKMSDEEWEEAYRAAWARYYTPEHIRTILRRTGANKIGRPGTTLSTILWFYLMILFEGVHPLEGGALPAEVPPRPAQRHAAGKSARVLSALLAAARRSRYCDYWSVYLRCKAILDEALAGAGPLELFRPRHRAAEGRRVRGARPLSRHHRRRGRARAQISRRRDPRQDRRA